MPVACLRARSSHACRALDLGLDERDFAEAGDRLDRIEDNDLARYGLDASVIGRLRECFAGWPRS